MRPTPSDYAANTSDSQETMTSTTAGRDAHGHHRHRHRHRHRPRHRPRAVTRMTMRTRKPVSRGWNAAQKDSQLPRLGAHLPDPSHSRPGPRMQASAIPDAWNLATSSPLPAQNRSHSSPARRSGLNSLSPRRSALPTAEAAEAPLTSTTTTFLVYSI